MKSAYSLISGIAAIGLLVMTSCGQDPAPSSDEGKATRAAGAAANETPAPDSIDTPDRTRLVDFTSNAEAGKSVFARCRSCHSLNEGANRSGPSLYSIVGRKAGTVPGFRYSDANANSGITWTPENLFRFLENPRRTMPGSRMVLRVSDPQDRADLIAFLAEQSEQQ